MKYQPARQIFVRLALMPCSRCPSNQVENKNTKEKKNNKKQVRLQLQTIILPIFIYFSTRFLAEGDFHARAGIRQNRQI